MSHETMAWMQIKLEDLEGNIAGYKAFVQLLQYNTVDIQDPRTGATVAYLSERDNDALFESLNQFDIDSKLTLMGYGDSWSFNHAQTLIDLLLENKEQVLEDMLIREKDRSYVKALFDTLEQSDVQIKFINLVFREEDIDVLEGFDEFVWCMYDGCKVPATYNFKRLSDGNVKGRDDFPANIGITEDDLPYCERHFNELTEKENA